MNPSVRSIANTYDPRFSASLLVNQTGQMSPLEENAFERVFDNFSRQSITGRNQTTFRQWLETNLHDGLEIAVERTEKRSNAFHDTGLRLNIRLNGDLYEEMVIPQSRIQRMKANRFVNTRQTDRTLFCWGKNLQLILSRLNAAFVDTFGWENTGTIFQNNAASKFYQALNELPENELAVRPKPTNTVQAG